MNQSSRCILFVLWSLIACSCAADNGPATPPAAAAAQPADPLPSWDKGATKKSISDFVARVTREGGPDFVPQHPEWKTHEPFASLLKGDMAGVMASGEKRRALDRRHDPHRDDDRGILRNRA